MMLNAKEEQDWFGAESYESEFTDTVKVGFALGAGLALFQVAVIATAVTLGMITNKD
jgi:hypothetical protein